MLKGQLLDSSVISRSADQVSCELEGEHVILQLRSGTYYGLKDVGRRIWELLETPRTFSQIRKILEEEYAVSEQQCCEELSTFFQELAAQGLVEIQ